MLSAEGVARVTAWLQGSPGWSERFFFAARSSSGLLPMENASADAVTDHFTSGIFRTQVLAHVRANCLPALVPCMTELARSLPAPVPSKFTFPVQQDDAEGTLELLETLYGSVVMPGSLSADAPC